jgi:hypothetical protein
VEPPGLLRRHWLALSLGLLLAYGVARLASARSSQLAELSDAASTSVTNFYENQVKAGAIPL